MMTMDPLAITITGTFLIGGLIVMIKFIAERPSRKEMYDAIERNIQPIMNELKYIRERVDQLPVRKQGK